MFVPDIRSVIRHRQITPLFHPIYDVRSRTLLAHEALSRGPEGPLHAPAVLFERAAAEHVLAELEIACLEAALNAAASSGHQGRLFLNLSPDSLLNGHDWARDLGALCRRYGIDTGNCVLELTERALVEDYATIRETLRSLREGGFDFAIDDFGTGYSGLRMWSELRPDYVKIDRYFIDGIDSDPVKLEFVRSIVDMGRVVGSRIIAEGIETMDQWREVAELGVDAVQGFLFGQPDRALRSTAEMQVALDALEEDGQTACAEQLIVDVTPLSPRTPVREMLARLHEESHRDALPVVDGDGRPVGVVRRDRFLLLYSKPLHPEVLNKKAVAAVMDSLPLVVDARLRLEQVSRLVTRRARTQATDQFIICRDGRYAGIGYQIDLLRQLTEQRVRAATHCNPLTLLPGNLPINDNLNRLIAQGRNFVACYVDLDNFKPFNDHYGYARGDQVLLHVATLLQGAIQPRIDFVGHIGGDDFVIILRSEDWDRRLRGVIDAFAASVRNFYTPGHQAAGGIEARDRSGNWRRFGLLTLSIAALEVHPADYRSAEDVSYRLQAVKRAAKAFDGNSLVTNETPEAVNLAESTAAA